MSITLRPFESKFAMLQSSIDLLNVVKNKGRKPTKQEVYPYNDDGYILSFRKGEFNEHLRLMYAAEHEGKSDKEIDDYVTQAKKEFDDWFNNEGKNLYTLDNISITATLLDYKDLKKQFADCGLKITDTEAKKYFNSFKQPHQKPEEISGFGSKKYNKLYADEYNKTCQKISQLTAICNNKTNLATMLAESLLKAPENFEVLSKVSKAVCNIDGDKPDPEMILQAINEISDDDVSDVYSLLTSDETEEISNDIIDGHDIL